MFFMPMIDILMVVIKQWDQYQLEMQMTKKDCVVINGGSYNGGSNGCTFTPTHVDDLFFITGGCNFFKF